MMLMPRNVGANLTEYGGLHYIGASDFNIAQIVTYMFIHSTNGIAHLFFNMFTLFMFGITLERVLGGKRFLFYYLSCGIGATTTGSDGYITVKNPISLPIVFGPFVPFKSYIKLAHILGCT